MTPGAITPSQTVGPFFHGELLRAGATRHVLVPADAIGEHLRVEGHVYDGDRNVVPDALIEIWQANRHGHYHHAADEESPLFDTTFLGFGRVGTDSTGAYWFDTIRPGPVAYNETQWQAPHICLTVFARGLLNHLFTRLYFADDVSSANDPVLQRVPTERRASLLAHRTESSERNVYIFDIVLQGDGETVFFDFGRERTSGGARSRS